MFYIVAATLSEAAGVNNFAFEVEKEAHEFARHWVKQMFEAYPVSDQAGFSGCEGVSLCVYSCKGDEQVPVIDFIRQYFAEDVD